MDRDQTQTRMAVRRPLKSVVRLRVMRRRPGVWLVARDCPGIKGHLAPYTVYSIRIRRRYDGCWYENYNTGRFAGALAAWKRECA